MAQALAEAMSENLVHELPEASRLALASAGRNREIWLSVFALDARIGSYVLGAQEPLLAQMRIAWWRDELRKDPETRPKGDKLLDLIGDVFNEEPKGLLHLLDGWEALLAQAPLGAEPMEGFAGGRTKTALFIADMLARGGRGEDAKVAARQWALADLAHRLPEESDRALALRMAAGKLRKPRLPRPLMPLAVLAGLSRRALSRGGTPLLGDRFSPLVALRLGILGR